MAELIRTRTANDLPEAPFRTLKARFQGELIYPGVAGYEDARHVWNGMIDRHPALIARCSSAADVSAAVRFGRECDLLVAVRGGGHNVAGTAVCDDGLVIDLSRMNGLRVDSVRRTARAEPGLLWEAVDRQTQEAGLAVTGGVVSHTGVAGLTLGGGLGWLMRKHGLTCDNLISADLVTAEGESLTAGEQQHPDLFWAIRGGGGNFGIVTSFTFRLHPHGPEVLAGPILYPADQAEDVLRAYRDFIVTAPDELGTGVILAHAPPAPWIPDSIHGQPVVLINVCYAGPVEEGRRVVAPLRRLGTPLVEGAGPTRYVAHQSMLDPGVPHGHHYYWKSHYFNELSDAAIRTLVGRAWEARSAMSYIIIFHLGGAVGRVSEDATAFQGRRATHAVVIDAVWPPDMEEGREDIEWARGMWEALVPFSTGGVYMNFLGDEGPERVRAAYGPENYERLRAVKQQYDPSNFFRVNQNIRPAGSNGESESW